MQDPCHWSECSQQPTDVINDNFNPSNIDPEDANENGDDQYEQDFPQGENE